MGLFDIVEEKKEGKSIVKVTVASGIEKPYFKTKYGMTPKGAFIRIGTSAEPMPHEMIDRLFSVRTRNSIGRMISNRQDLTFEQLRIYYDEHGKRLNENFARSLELLTEDGKYNYVAYLLADDNGNSIKVAKYSSLDRCDLIENNEYGYCSLIKATKSVLAKLDIENKTAATITSMERIETPLWNKVALREAVINAIVHNDYSFEVPPKFEKFPDRIEITSAGRLPESLSREEFFSGISIPRNKELMRIYRDVELVESLGSGIPRILRAYGEDSFKFTDNFIRITFPVNIQTDHTNDHASVQVSEQVKLLIISLEKKEMSVAEIMQVYKLVYKQVYKSVWYFKKHFILPAIQQGFVEMVYPMTPNHPKQKYRLTPIGLQLQETIKKQDK